MRVPPAAAAANTRQETIASHRNILASLRNPGMMGLVGALT